VGEPSAADGEGMTTTVLPPPVPSRRRRRLPTWAKVLLWLATSVVVVVGAGLLWFAAMLSGGFDDLFSLPGPEEGDRTVVQARAAEVERLQSDSRVLVTGVASPVLGPDPVATGTTGSCRVGQHNWKIDDSFDLLCTDAHLAVVRGGDTAAFRGRAVALHERLLAEGWEPASHSPGLPERSSIAWVLSEYWDPSDGRTSPSRLPAADYVRGRDGLTLEWLAAGDGDAGGYLAGDALLTTTDGSTLPAGRAGLLVPGSTWAVSLVLHTTSFQA
jgi:hypothetical protein